jgi:gluconate 2-dehydrogenase gamma chain
MQNRFTRRSFLQTTADAARGSCIVLSLPAILATCKPAEQGSVLQFQILTEEEVLEFSAIAARIIPTDETPGATEAGAINFMDQVLNDGRERELALLQSGLRELQTAAALTFEAGYFYLLEPEQQDQLLTEMEDTQFFGTIRYLTIASMFAAAEYGGAGKEIGYALVGFEDRHAWQAPYGYYDADFAEKGE